MHLKDMTAAGEQAEVGGGVTDWPAILLACRAAGTEWLIVEQDDCPGDPLECLAVSHRNLVALLRDI
jgi:sugar phosphate isomerase/epimerase